MIINICIYMNYVNGLKMVTGLNYELFECSE